MKEEVKVLHSEYHVAYRRSAPLNSRGLVQRSFLVARSYQRLPDSARSTLFLRKRVVTRLRSTEAIRSARRMHLNAIRRRS